MNRFLLLAAALFFASVASAVVVETEVRAEASASPEAMPDPMDGLSLVAMPASGSVGSQKELGATSTICPSDYTNGYSIMCRSSQGRAAFYADGKWLRTEVAAPFYAAGNDNGKVNKFSPPSGKMSFTLACKSGGDVVRSRISIMC